MNNFKYTFKHENHFRTFVLFHLQIEFFFHWDYDSVSWLISWQTQRLWSSWRHQQSSDVLICIQHHIGPGLTATRAAVFFPPSLGLNGAFAVPPQLESTWRSVDPDGGLHLHTRRFLISNELHWWRSLRIQHSMFLVKRRLMSKSTHIYSDFTNEVQVLRRTPRAEQASSGYSRSEVDSDSSTQRTKSEH